MAKEIKVIKCPQCGSTQNTEIKPDFFKCSHCGTEYFLDNDDININYSYKPSPQVQPVLRPVKGRALLFFILLVFVLIFGLIRWALSGSGSGRSVSGFTIPGAKSETASPVLPSKEESYSSWSSQNMAFFRPGKRGAPILCVVGVRDYHYPATDESKDGVYLSFYDMAAKKELLVKKIAPAGRIGSSSVDSRTFVNGDMYFILDHKRVFRVDPSSLDAVEATGPLFGSQRQLQAGVATVDFVPESAGDGFRVMTNEGASFAYYPVVDKLYTQQALSDAEQGFRTLLHGGRDSVYFTFTSQAFDFPDEKIQLLKIRYKDNQGGPVEIRSSFSWRRDYGRSGIFTEADPYRKVLIDNRYKDVLRITGFGDLTPGRLYFGPSVVFGNDRHLLILVKATAAPDAVLNLQSLDPNTGAIRWTMPAGNDRPNKALPFEGGYLLTDRYHAELIDTSGNTISEYKIK